MDKIFQDSVDVYQNNIKVDELAYNFETGKYRIKLSPGHFNQAGMIRMSMEIAKREDLKRSAKNLTYVLAYIFNSWGVEFKRNALKNFEIYFVGLDFKYQAAIKEALTKNILEIPEYIVLNENEEVMSYDGTRYTK